MPPVRFAVREVPPRATRALRREVLRPGARLDEALQDDEAPGARGFAAFTDDAVPIACGLVLPAAPPAPLRARVGRDLGFRLRGMATVPEHRGEGAGTLVLAACMDYVAEAGGGLLWCHARVPARSLYERAGFAVEGEPFEEPGIGPHLLMWVRVAPASADRSQSPGRERPGSPGEG